MSSFAYNDRQRQRDAEYTSAYSRWLKSLSPAQRARVQQLGIGEADTAGSSCGKHVDLDVERMADAQLPEKTNEFKLAMSEAYAEFLQWVVIPHPRGGINPKAIAQRAVVAMWVLRPDIIGNLSLTEIGVIMDARADVLSEQASKFSKRFGIRGRAQFSAKTRKAQSASAKRRNAPNAKETTPELPLLPADPSLN